MWVRAWLVTFVALGCSDAGLTPIIRHQAIAAHVCAPGDLLGRVSHKVLFVIDTSFSNSWTDPAPKGEMPRRELAVRDAISQHANDEEVSWGIITFSDEPHRQTYGFIRDPDILNGAVANVGQEQGGTNYSDTLWASIDFILTDLAQLPESEASRTRYIVHWLSDGFPTVGVVDGGALVPGVQYLHDALQERGAMLSFNAAFLASEAPVDVDPDEYEILNQQARQLLQEMASVGGGSFADFEASEPIGFELDSQILRRRFTLVSVVATNRNARFGPGYPVADSDADGIIDEDEPALGLDPSNPDTDGDGIRDGFEEFQISQERDDDCVGGSDLDGDDLADCEELLLGTDLTESDSDGDRLPDLLEVMGRGPPLINDPSADSDQDGIPDETEMRLHLPLDTPNTPEEMQTWAYEYQLIEPEDEKDPALQDCYSFEVRNVALVPTLETAANPAGSNQIRIVAAFEPLDGDSPTVFKVADQSVELPAARGARVTHDTIEVADTDFRQMR